MKVALASVLVDDPIKAFKFYTEVLGFTQTGYYPIESQPVRTEIRRDGVAIVLYTEAVHVDDSTPKFTGGLYIFPENVDSLARELRDKVPFAWGPEQGEYGYRQFAIRDPDGYLLIFAEPDKT